MPGQRDGGMEIQVIHDAKFMELDGLHRDVEHRGHLFGPSPLRDELQHLSLTRREGGDSRADRHTCRVALVGHHHVLNEE